MGNQCKAELDRDISPKNPTPKGSPTGAPAAAPEERREEPCSLIREVFESMVVSDVLRPTVMLTLSSKDSPLEGFKRLVERNVHSAPVKDHETGEWIG